MLIGPKILTNLNQKRARDNAKSRLNIIIKYFTIPEKLEAMQKESRNIMRKQRRSNQTTDEKQSLLQEERLRHQARYRKSSETKKAEQKAFCLEQETQQQKAVLEDKEGRIDGENAS